MIKLKPPTELLIKQALTQLRTIEMQLNALKTTLQIASEEIASEEKTENDPQK